MEDMVVRLLCVTRSSTDDTDLSHSTLNSRLTFGIGVEKINKSPGPGVRMCAGLPPGVRVYSRPR